MRRLALVLLTAILAACSGTETIPGDTAAFSATGYNSYAWRSEPLKASGYSKDKIYQADPAIRAAVDARMAELGYRLVPRDNAEFLVEYLAATGVNAGLMESTASNVTPYPSATINRLPDGASVDNAYALGGAKETKNVMLVFVERSSLELLWQVHISAIMQDANRVDPDSVRRAIRQGLATLPEAP